MLLGQGLSEKTAEHTRARKANRERPSICRVSFISEANSALVILVNATAFGCVAGDFSFLAAAAMALPTLKYLKVKKKISASN